MPVVDNSYQQNCMQIWRAAADVGLAVSCAGSAAEFGAPEFAELIEALHDQRQAVFGLARYPNVFIKVPGLGELANRAMPPQRFHIR
jgi:L-fuconolactonase